MLLALHAGTPLKSRNTGPALMKLLCPAKINLSLEVLAAQADGYHALRSVMVPIAFYDELSIESSDEFSFICDDAALDNADNLVVRAARALVSEPRMRIELRKRIPFGAGLGGGSSDAAGVLRAAMADASLRAQHGDWVSLARSLGSDVPFFLAGTAALVEGTGERATAIGAIPPWHVLVVKPPVNVSTSEAYAALDAVTRQSRPRNTSKSLAIVEALQRGDFDAVQGLLTNDFHESVSTRVPEVRHALDALVRAGAPRPMLSGSGSAVFALAQDEQAIRAILRCLDLPPEYVRFDVPFASTPDWRGSIA